MVSDGKVRNFSRTKISNFVVYMSICSKKSVVVWEQVFRSKVRKASLRLWINTSSKLAPRTFNSDSSGTTTNAIVLVNFPIFLRNSRVHTWSSGRWSNCNVADNPVLRRHNSIWWLSTKSTSHHPTSAAIEFRYSGTVHTVYIEYPTSSRQGLFAPAFRCANTADALCNPAEGERSDCKPKWAYQLPTHSSEHLNGTHSWYNIMQLIYILPFLYCICYFFSVKGDVVLCQS